jgi:hypothetical protein
MSAVSIYDRFEDLPGAYREAFNPASVDIDHTDFFSSLPWFRHLADTVLDSQHRPRIYCEASGLALPMCHAAARTGIFGARRMTALANFYTPLYQALTNDSVTAQSDTQVQHALSGLVQSMANERPRWDSIDLHPMDPDSAAFRALIAAFRAAGMPVQRYFCFANWYLEVNGRSYQEYFDTLPSMLRHTLIRKSRQLEKTNRLHIEIVSTQIDRQEKLESCIAAYEQIYRASWKAEEPFPSFIPGLIRLCAEHGWLRLGIAYVDDKPAAAQLWIVYNRIASIYKLAYIERLSNLSIGSILTSQLMRHVIDIDHVTQVDFLSGDDAYKRDWMSHRRERWGMMAFNLQTIRGAISALKHLGGRYAKNLISGTRTQ